MTHIIKAAALCVVATGVSAFNEVVALSQAMANVSSISIAIVSTVIAHKYMQGFSDARSFASILLVCVGAGLLSRYFLQTITPEGRYAQAQKIYEQCVQDISRHGIKLSDDESYRLQSNLAEAMKLVHNARCEKQTIWFAEDGSYVCRASDDPIFVKESGGLMLQLNKTSTYVSRITQGKSAIV